MIFSALPLLENLIRFIVLFSNIKSILFYIFLFPNYVYRLLRSIFILFLRLIISIFKWARFFIIIKIIFFTLIVIWHWRVIQIIWRFNCFWFLSIKFFLKNFFFLFHEHNLLFYFHLSWLSLMKIRFHNNFAFLINSNWTRLLVFWIA
jgi:hypothetical protein